MRDKFVVIAKERLTGESSGPLQLPSDAASRGVECAMREGEVNSLVEVFEASVTEAQAAM